jgi:hypothetical protein
MIGPSWEPAITLVGIMVESRNPNFPPIASKCYEHHILWLNQGRLTPNLIFPMLHVAAKRKHSIRPRYECGCWLPHLWLKSTKQVPSVFHLPTAKPTKLGWIHQSSIACLWPNIYLYLHHMCFILIDLKCHGSTTWRSRIHLLSAK